MHCAFTEAHIGIAWVGSAERDGGPRAMPRLRRHASLSEGRIVRRDGRSRDALPMGSYLSVGMFLEAMGSRARAASGPKDTGAGTRADHSSF